MAAKKVQVKFPDTRCEACGKDLKTVAWVDGEDTACSKKCLSTLRSEEENEWFEEQSKSAPETRDMGDLSEDDDRRSV